MLNRCAVEDTRLSFKAVGILTYLLSKPDNWKVREEDLAQRHTDGTTAVRSGLKELKDLGYLVSVPLRDTDGRVIEWETHVYEVPQIVENGVEKSHIVGNPHSGESTFSGTDHIVSNESLVSKQKSEQSKLPRGEFVFGEVEKPLSYCEITAEKLRTALLARRKLMVPADVKKWAASFRKFLIEADISREELDPVIAWYCEHIGEDYVPHAFSADSFCKKFVQIKSQMELSSKLKSAGNDAVREALRKKWSNESEKT